MVSWNTNLQSLSIFRDGPLETYGGGGGVGEVRKKILKQGKIKWKKKHEPQ